MEIIRIASMRKTGRGWHHLIKPTTVESIRTNEDHNIELQIKYQKEGHTSGGYNYKVLLTADDLGKIMAELFKQVLTKSK